MEVEFICNNKLIQINKATDVELDQLNIISTGHDKKWARDRFGNSKMKDEYKSFLTNWRYLPGGFWLRVLKLIENGYNVNFKNFNQFVRTNVTEESFTEWIETLPLKFKKLRYYQIEATYNLLRFPYSMAELAPSAGKTLIIYLLCRYLLENILNKIWMKT